jgi:hypothetical protein
MATRLKRAWDCDWWRRGIVHRSSVDTRLRCEALRTIFQVTVPRQVCECYTARIIITLVEAVFKRRAYRRRNVIVREVAAAKYIVCLAPRVGVGVV